MSTRLDPLDCYYGSTVNPNFESDDYEGLFLDLDDYLGNNMENPDLLMEKDEGDFLLNYDKFENVPDDSFSDLDGYGSNTKNQVSRPVVVPLALNQRMEEDDGLSCDLDRRTDFENENNVEMLKFLKALRGAVPVNYAEEKKWLKRVKTRAKDDSETLKRKRKGGKNFVDCKITVGKTTVDFRAHCRMIVNLINKMHYNLQGSLFGRTVQIYPVSKIPTWEKGNVIDYDCYMRIGEIAFKVIGKFTRPGWSGFSFRGKTENGTKVEVISNDNGKARRRVDREKNRTNKKKKKAKKNQDKKTKNTTGQKRKRKYEMSSRKRQKCEVQVEGLSLEKFLEKNRGLGLQNNELLEKIKKLSEERAFLNPMKRRKRYKPVLMQFNGHVSEMIGHFKRPTRTLKKGVDHHYNFEGELKLENRTVNVMVYSENAKCFRGRKEDTLLCSIDGVVFKLLGKFFYSAHSVEEGGKRKVFHYIKAKAEEIGVEFIIEEKINGYKPRRIKK